ncbi:MAG: amidohydrolase family protein [Alphaproteobacteria bacterium]|nr:amidohydrolase family protein [Alphaproteobacteria bacterium]
MIIDFSSRPPLPDFNPQAGHLQNYRRVYRKSESQVDRDVGDKAFEDYMAMYDAMDAHRVVLKARDLETTFGFKISNETVADLCRRYPDRFIGFAGVDPHKGDAALDELEHAVRDLGLLGLNVQCFEHRLPINDPKLMRLYEKCVELDIPVNIHCGTNFSLQSEMRFGQPLLLDSVLTSLPELRVCASPPGWPWVHELLAVAWRHPNLWIGILAIRQKLLAVNGSGYEPLLTYGKAILADRMIFGSSYPMMPVDRCVSEIRSLELGSDVEQKWLFGNAARFLRVG